ncbi:Uncharacterised protein [Chlamydia trachomatis]|nr:Uncharacterised protein [Chlamydia trachomatis]CRH48848.1 Uncharacterised protein [Chlamydia trachomatis]
MIPRFAAFSIERIRVSVVVEGQISLISKVLSLIISIVARRTMDPKPSW